MQAMTSRSDPLVNLQLQQVNTPQSIRCVSEKYRLNAINKIIDVINFISFFLSQSLILFFNLLIIFHTFKNLQNKIVRRYVALPFSHDTVGLMHLSFARSLCNLKTTVSVPFLCIFSSIFKIGKQSWHFKLQISSDN